MGKIKKEILVKEEPGPASKITKPLRSHDRKVNNCSVIASPMATKKLCKKIYELIKQANTQKRFLRSGLKLVQKFLRLGETGLVIFAGDISPIDIMCHLPIVCEEKNIPYCYVPSRKDIGLAMGVSRGCIMVLIKEHDSYKELYDEVVGEIKLLPYSIFPNVGG